MKISMSAFIVFFYIPNKLRFNNFVPFYVFLDLLNTLFNKVVSIYRLYSVLLPTLDLPVICHGIRHRTTKVDTRI